MQSTCLVLLKQVPADYSKMVINPKKKNEQLTITVRVLRIQGG